jgi:hypothetical protein
METLEKVVRKIEETPQGRIHQNQGNKPSVLLGDVFDLKMKTRGISTRI